MFDQIKSLKKKKKIPVFFPAILVTDLLSGIRVMKPRIGYIAVLLSLADPLSICLLPRSLITLQSGCMRFMYFRWLFFFTSCTICVIYHVDVALLDIFHPVDCEILFFSFSHLGNVKRPRSQK